MPNLKKLTIALGLGLVASISMTSFAWAGYASFADAKAAAEAQNKPLLIDFYTEW